MKTALLILVIVIGLLVAGAFIAAPQIKAGLSTMASTPQGTKVRLQTIKTTSLTEMVKAPGQIEPHTKVDISSEVSARIEQLPFREGDTVSKGDIVVRLDDRDLKAALDAAEARRDGEAFRLQAEQARLTGLLNSQTFAQKQLERRQALYDSGDLPRKELDDALERVGDLQSQIDSTKYAISVIESSLAGAKADIDRATQSLARTVIRAPMDGVITALNAEVGEVVLVGTMNNPGTVILTVADLSRMILKAEISESDIAKIKEGQTARVHINAYRDEVFSGVVTEIALQRTLPRQANANTLSSSTTGYFEAEVEIDLRGRLILSGLMANVDIEVASHEGLSVESQAIVDRPIEELPDAVKRENSLVDPTRKVASVVYRNVNGKAICTPVRRGPSDDTHSIVLDGLNEDDVVVVGPFKVLEKIKHDEAIMDEQAAPTPSAPTPQQPAAAEQSDDTQAKTR